MLRDQLDVSLNQIVGNRPLANVVYSLLEWAESRNQIPDVITGVRRANPYNQDLIQIEAMFHSIAGQK